MDFLYHIKTGGKNLLRQSVGLLQNGVDDCRTDEKWYAVNIRTRKSKRRSILRCPEVDHSGTAGHERSLLVIGKGMGFAGENLTRFGNRILSVFEDKTAELIFFEKRTDMAAV